MVHSKMPHHIVGGRVGKDVVPAGWGFGSGGTGNLEGRGNLRGYENLSGHGSGPRPGPRARGQGPGTETEASWRELAPGPRPWFRAYQLPDLCRAVIPASGISLCACFWALVGKASQIRLFDQIPLRVKVISSEACLATCQTSHGILL